MADFVLDVRFRQRFMTGCLSEIAHELGADIADAFARAFGGGRLYVPTRPNAPLLKTLGLAGALWLCETYGGDDLDVPLGSNCAQARRLAAVAGLKAEGASNTAIARTLGISARTVFTYVKKFGLATSG